MSRYNDINYVMNLNIEEGISLINKSFEKQEEDILLKRWIIHYQHELSFEEFKSQVSNKMKESNDQRSEDEILSEVKEVLSTFGEVKEFGNI